LKFEATVKPFLSGSVAPELSSVYLTTAEGTLLRCSYPDFKLREAYRLPGIGYQVSCDAKRGLLYGSVFDPKSLASPPGERAGGELQIYDLSGLEQSTAKGR